jgi:UDP-sulfoquinovose synthase
MFLWRGFLRVLILGADGYLGWPTCLYFSQRDHEVIGVDNYFRRNAAEELGCESLIPTPKIVQRAKIWDEITGRNITVYVGDVTDYG